MSIFNIHNEIVESYKSYVSSFVNIVDARIRTQVQDSLENGELWPSPLLQFNPSYKVEQSTTEIPENILHSDVKHCFPHFQLYKHQLDAITLGAQDKGFIVTSGTGSGKSLTFFATIFNDYFNSKKNNGVKALLVYPMNALVNSQKKEFEDYASNYKRQTGSEFPITCGIYTGQETREEKESIISNPPTILMTNYVMLEYLMTRGHEKQLRDNIFRHLKYVVYDELHTFRGRQGADVAILNRRINVLCENSLVFIGTSATMASDETTTHEKEKELIASVGRKFFGHDFRFDQIIGETLERQFDSKDHSIDALKRSFKNAINETDGIEKFIHHPLSAWIEKEVGIEDRDGRLVRRKPISLDEFYQKLATQADVSLKVASEFFESYSNWLNQINIDLQKKKKGKQLLPFKLHQFIAQTGSVFTTLDSRSQRKITLEAGRFIHDPDSNKRRDLFPVVFSRDSGLDFLCVSIDKEGKINPRYFDQNTESEDDNESSNIGYIVLDLYPQEPLWSEEFQNHLPDSYFRFNKSGKKLKKEYAEKMPQRIYINSDGYKSSKPSNLPAWFITAPLKIDPLSGLLYSGNSREYSKLTMLSSEARSTSTTILNREALKAIRKANLRSFEDKILTFSDNVQDTALQSGHFNDFNRVIEFRKALYKSVCTKDISASEIASVIKDNLGLKEGDYAENPSDDGSIKIGKTPNEEAFEELLFFRALQDLALAWKVTLPNLEQVGLVNFSYRNLEEIASDESWSNLNGFAELNPSKRSEILYALMEYFRSKYSIIHNKLDEQSLTDTRKTILNRVNNAWGLSANEILLRPSLVVLEEKPSWGYTNYIFAGYNSGVKRFFQTFSELKSVTSTKEDYDSFIHELFSKLTSTLLRKKVLKTKKGEIDVYGLDLDSLIWSRNTSSTIYENPIRIKRAKSKSSQHINSYFRQLYSDDAKSGLLDISQDHTGLVSKEDRKKWEQDFIDKKIQSLFCSPTMELGIDIDALSLVMMRNAPPNPANYVQRSGRAGRSGQAALVMTYCSSSSAHDQHYFKNKIDLVAGKVNPPTINLENENLLRTHLHAVYLSFLDIDQFVNEDANGRQGVVNLVDLHTYELIPSVEERLRLSDEQRKALEKNFLQIIANFSNDPSLEKITTKWIKEAPTKFRESLSRWIELHKNTSERQKQVSEKISRRDNYIDKNKQRELEIENRLLLRTLDKLEGIKSHNRDNESEFYIYRYLADEGFTPGYNFPSVPMRANLHQRNGDIKLIQRAKGVAIREFGPGNIIYNGGSKYKVQGIKKDNIVEGFEKAEINEKSGVILLGDKEVSRDVDPVLGEFIKPQERKPLTHLLEVDMVDARPRDHISCEEEERRRSGYVVKKYLEAKSSKLAKSNSLQINSKNNRVITLRYIPSALLYNVLEGYKSGNENDRDVFIDKSTGKYLSKKDREDLHKSGAVGQDVIVRPYVKEITDVLYFSPTEELGLESNGIVTLQYAIERGIALTFNMEENEVGSELMGGQEIQNVMFYENSEGSLGVLKQISEDPSLFKDVIRNAYQLCFPEHEPAEKRKLPATYENLLSYRNQFCHDIIDRALIKDTLLLLLDSTIISESGSQQSYDEQFHSLMSKRDKKSANEKVFLEYLYKHGLKLPDKSQFNIKDIYVNVDFYYDPQTVIFIDGSVHDQQRVIEEDSEKRSALAAAGYTVLAWNYRTKIEDFIAANSWCFPKIKD